MNNYKPISSPITWFGSKSRLVKNIVQYFPEHITYVDVFGGSGAVLLGKPPSKVEVYNDLNDKMACLFRVLSDKNKTRELIRRLTYTPYSRSYFNNASALINNVDDEIELAKLMIVIQRQSHGGLGKTWSYCITDSAKGYSSAVRKFHAGIERLPIVRERMRRVQIENLCFRNLIPRYDRPQTLFYLDPPYIPESRISGKYEMEMTLEDHKEMIDIILSCKGKFVLSGYNNTIYSILEDKGWRKIEIDTIASTSKTRGKRTECLWISQ